jgi:hypothetical protein
MVDGTQMTEQELIDQAIEAFGPLGEDHIGQKIGELGLALEAFYMNSFSDQEGGNADYGLGHRYRVDRWVMWTNSQGFHSIEAFQTDTLAEQAMDSYDKADDDSEEEE